MASAPQLVSRPWKSPIGLSRLGDGPDMNHRHQRHSTDAHAEAASTSYHGTAEDLATLGARKKE